MRVVHQIWVGDAPVPARLRAYGETVKRCFDGFDYWLWDEQRVSQELWVNEEICQGRSGCNVGMRADVLRLEILCKYGGVYLDMDFECLRPCAELFTALMGKEVFGYGDELSGRPSNALLFATAEHPLLRFFVEKCKYSLIGEGLMLSPVKATGPEALAKLLNVWCGTWNACGAVMDGGNQIGNYYSAKSVCALWKEFFYPYHYKQENWATFDPLQHPLAYMVHHWEGAWNR